MLPRGGVTPRQRRPPALMCRLLPRCLSSLRGDRLDMSAGVRRCRGVPPLRGGFFLIPATSGVLSKPSGCLCNPSGACLDIGELVYTFRLLSSLMYVGRGIGAPSPRHCPELVPPMYPPFAPLGNSGVPPAPVGESLRRDSRSPDRPPQMPGRAGR